VMTHGSSGKQTSSLSRHVIHLINKTTPHEYEFKLKEKVCAAC
jgi:hypothetical protein